TYGFNKTIAADTIRFIVTVAIVVYKGLIPVVGRILTMGFPSTHSALATIFHTRHSMTGSRRHKRRLYL
ncbi:hypothetical protein DW047_23090, partial [Phocaeicola vulgatus]